MQLNNVTNHGASALIQTIVHHETNYNAHHPSTDACDICGDSGQTYILVCSIGFESPLLPTASEGWGKVMFSVCSQGRRGYPEVPIPHPPRYLPLTKVPTPPHPSQDGGGGTPMYLPPAKVPPPPCRSGRGRGYPKVLNPPPTPIQVWMGGGLFVWTLRYLPPTPGIGQHMEYLIRCGRYASCVHAGGLSCLDS